VTGEPRPPRGRSKIALPAAFAAPLALPLVAMLFTDQVAWTARDFAAMALLLAAAGLGWELATRRSASPAFRAGAAVALAAALLLVWANAAVGVVGGEDAPVNRLFDLIPATALAGALFARFRAAGLARALAATAAAQLAVAAGVAATGLASRDLLFVTLFFTALWLAAAWLFARAARRP
jgi:hypothetical protein